MAQEQCCKRRIGSAFDRRLHNRPCFLFAYSVSGGRDCGKAQLITEAMNQERQGEKKLAGEEGAETEREGIRERRNSKLSRVQKYAITRSED